MLSRKVSFPLTCFTFTRRGSRFQHHHFNRWYQGCSGCCEIASPAPPQIQAARVGWLPAQFSVTNPLSFSLDWGHSVMAQKSSVLFFFSTLMEQKLWQQKRWANCNYTTIRNAFCILQQFWGKWRVCFETSLQRWKKKRGRGQESWSTLWKSCTTLNCWNGSVDLLVHAVACYLWLGRDLEDIDSLVGFCFPSSSLSVGPQSRQWGAEGPASWVGSRWSSVAA